MKLKLYVVRDEVALDNSVLLTAKSNDEVRRNISALMVAPQRNFLNTDIKDKRIFCVGELETSTGVITADPVPLPVFPLEEIRQEVLADVAAKKAQAMLVAIDKGLDESKAKDYLALLETANFFDLKTSREIALEEENKQLKLFISMQGKDNNNA